MAIMEDQVCPGCKCSIHEPYIKCAECEETFILCVECFSKGFELLPHINSHAYEVITLDFSVLDNNWTAGENMLLLNSIIECGLGNWSAVAHRVGTKTSNQCERHYINNYLSNPNYGLQNLLNNSKESNKNTRYHMIPYKPSEQPPRPNEDSNVELSSYMPCRGDFIEEYDNYAEFDIKDVCYDQEDTELEENLKIAAVEIYIRRVKERCYRKKIVREYGLINWKKSEMFDNIQSKFEKYIRDKMRPLCRLQVPEENEKFIQSLLLESCLKQEIKELQQYRSASITLNDSIGLYQISHEERVKHKNKSTMLSGITSLLEDKSACQNWLQKQALCQTSLPFSLPNLGRKPASRLDISGTPGIEKLSDEEKELCSALRLLPYSYLTYKEMLVKQSEAFGSLRLAQARTLIKIDVNKTRKLFDFCVKQNWIRKYEM